MRIIAGQHRRRAIVPPANFKARPTTDFAKENLFNVIGNYFEFEDLAILDLFSGTGSISYEFASRGAAKVVSIEQNPLHHKFIAATAQQLKMNVIQVVCTNTFVYLRSVKGTKFDIVFADPPYDLEQLETIPDLVFQADIIHPEGWLILEHGENHDFSSHPRFLQTRKYGSVNFSIFE